MLYIYITFIFVWSKGLLFREAGRLFILKPGKYVFGIFKNHNPFAVIALFILTIITRLAFVSNAGMPLVSEGQYFWQWLTDTYRMDSDFFNYVMFFVLICNVFGQALLLNWISTKHSLFPRYSYLPAYMFVVLSALLKEWNIWSVYIILNWLLLILLNSILKLYLAREAKTLAFNVGFVSACTAILLMPASVVVLLALAGLAILRPFKLAEWVSLLVGFLLPYYFFISICYLTDALYLTRYIFRFDFELVRSISAGEMAAAGMLLATVLFSLYYTGYYINRMVVETKKYWSVILIAAFTGLGMTITTMHSSYAGAVLLIPAIALFGSFTYFEQYRKWIPDLFAFVLLAGVIAIQWFLK